MADVFTPQDQEVRDRIETSLDENLFVEAGAGTGKTTSLVKRVLGLVVSQRTTLDRIAAITFTEAAAAELRDRIRESLERRAEDPQRSEDEQQRCQQGIRDLDQASIQTLHSFAANLLQERPLEAGLPPSFEIMDAIAGDLAFAEVWSRWLDAALDDPDLAPDLALAFSLGLTPEQLRKVALKFHQEYDRLVDVKFDDRSPVEPRAAAELVGAASELARCCRFSNLPETDPLFSHVQGMAGPLRRLAEVEPGSLEAYRLLQRLLPLRTTAGNINNWEEDPETGVNACRQLKARLGELHEIATDELSQLRQGLMVPLLGSLRQMVLEYAVERKRQGRAEFHDLLVWSRDLLRDNIEVRDHFRQRFSHLLIDEAQDTDPIQAEIAMFLAEDASALPSPSDRTHNWEEVVPASGKLFVVGDPKQSIYRFRRADVAQMGRLRERLNGDTVRLVQNFRSHQPVLTWVNHVFQQWMSQGDQQTEYISVTHRWEVTTDHPFRPRTWRLGGVLEDKTLPPVRRKEAQDIAALLQNIIQGEWPVLDQPATHQAGEERYRPASYADICILMPRRTALRSLELALDQAGLPYRLEGASLIFDTQEVRDLINCLRAIDDPADQVALVAALRSPAFACTDVDLLRYVQAGGKLNYLAGTGDIAGDTSGDNSGETTGKNLVETSGPVAEGCRVLRRFHRDRLWTSIPFLIDRFLRERLLLEAALDHSRTREQWRRYQFMVERSRAFVEVGGNSLRAFLEWVEHQAEEGARVTEAPVPEIDEAAVRVMTIHAAKGLEFPVVVLTGLNSEHRPGADDVLFDRSAGRAEVKMGTQDRLFSTLGYEALAIEEKERDREEYVRLLYVAATRARDHLVLCMHRTSGNDKSVAGQIAQFLEGADQLWEPVGDFLPLPAEQSDMGPATASSTKPEDHTLAHRDAWLKQRQNTLNRQSKPVAVAATTLASFAKKAARQEMQPEVQQEVQREVQAEEPWKRGRGGTSLGRAVHAVLQTADLATGQGLAELARAQATVEGIVHREREILALAKVAIASTVVRRAVAARRHWREVPVAAPLDDSAEAGIIEGFIDLLFEEEDGLVVVDYKTDAIEAEDTAELANRYRVQGGAYTLALEKATGKSVKEVVFLFLQPQSEESITDVAALKAEAENAAALFFSRVPAN